MHGTSTGIELGAPGVSDGSALGVGVELAFGVALRVGAGSGVVHPANNTDATSRADAEVTRAAARGMPPF